MEDAFGFVDIISPLSISDIYDQANKIWFHIYKTRVNPAKHHPFKPSFLSQNPYQNLSHLIIFPVKR
jgi:hypothetical protein